MAAHPQDPPPCPALSPTLSNCTTKPPPVRLEFLRRASSSRFALASSMRRRSASSARRRVSSCAPGRRGSPASARKRAARTTHLALQFLHKDAPRRFALGLGLARRCRSARLLARVVLPLPARRRVRRELCLYLLAKTTLLLVGRLLEAPRFLQPRTLALRRLLSAPPTAAGGRCQVGRGASGATEGWPQPGTLRRGDTSRSART